MNNTLSTTDKEAMEIIEKLDKSLQGNIASFEYATSNPHMYITMSILEIRAALFQLTRWQHQNNTVTNQSA